MNFEVFSYENIFYLFMLMPLLTLPPPPLSEPSVHSTTIYFRLFLHLMSSAEKECDRCGRLKPVAAFDKRVRTTLAGKAGELAALCQECVNLNKEARKRRAAAKNDEGNDSMADPGELDVMSLSVFFSVLEDLDGRIDMEARVELGEKSAQDSGPKERTTAIAKVVGDYMRIHWV